MRRLAAAAVALAACLAAAPAAATVTAAAVSTPADPAEPFFDVRGGPPYPTLAVAGTATTSGSTNNSVSLECYHGTASHFHFSGGTYAVSAGKWSGALPLSQLFGAECRLRAIPIDNNDPSNLASFPGPALRSSTLELRRIGVQPANPSSSPTGSASGPNAGRAYLWELNDARRTALWSLGSAGCAVTVGELIDPSNFAASSPLFLCAASLREYETSFASQATRTDIQVDGVNAIVPGEAANRTPDGPGLGTVTLDPERDDAGFTAGTGEELVRCRDASAPPTDAKCDSFAGVGVRLDRAVRESGDTQVDLTDRFTSTDGKAHDVVAFYEEGMGDGSVLPGWKFPGESAYTTRSASSVPPAVSGPFTIGLKSRNVLAEGDPMLTMGAMTISDTPASMHFSSESTLVVEVKRSVPAGGSSAPVLHTFVIGRHPADFAAQSAAAEDRQSPPVVKITSPADGTHVTDPSVTISGTVSDNRGVQSLKVAGTAVTPNPDGTWSTSLFLLPGTNHIVAQATDASGGSGTAEETLVLDATPEQDTTAPVLTKLRVVKRALRFVASEGVALTLDVRRFVRGRRSGRRCKPVKAGTAVPRRKRCTATRRVRRITALAAAGNGKVALRLGKHPVPGRYVVVVAAKDAAGNAAKRSRVRFRVLRPRKKHSSSSSAGATRPAARRDRRARGSRPPGGDPGRRGAGRRSASRPAVQR
jgi:hypothetical protein